MGSLVAENRGSSLAEVCGLCVVGASLVEGNGLWARGLQWLRCMD